MGEEEDEEYETEYIDPNDINIIQDSNNWHPSLEYIEAYAKQLGYDKDKDPKELINIAEKYLNAKLPINIKRAFTKNDLKILYIDMNTQEINLESDIEKQAKKEFDIIRNRNKNKKVEEIIYETPPIVKQNSNLENKKDEINSENKIDIKSRGNYI